MIINENKDLIYHIDCLVCIPKEYEHHAYIYEHNFKYVYILETNYKETINFIDFIRKNDVKEIILIDYRLEYEMITDRLADTTKISTILTFDLASLTNEYCITVHNAILNLYHSKKLCKIGVLDKNLYLLLKTQFEEVYLLYLDIPQSTKEDTKQEGIAILSDSGDAKHSYYNSLSAIRLLGKKVNVINQIDLVKGFNKEFGLEAKEFQTMKEMIAASEIALYINFCNSDNSVFFMCMDKGVPCIVGNNTLFEKDMPLKEMLQVKSDDNIDEIVEKVEEVSKNKVEILKQYEEYRKQYTKKSKESIENFLRNLEKQEIKNEDGNFVNQEMKQEREIFASQDMKQKIENFANQEEKQEYEKMLTIGIPVYNVENYVAKCIDSVLSFKHKDIEILIVNDGSTDGSEEVCMQYVKKYPDLVRYIKQENHGLGNVRNVILKNAKGKYIASIDSDDVINKNFFEEAWEALEKNVDMVICDWLSIFSKEEKFPTPALDNTLQFESNYKKILYSTIMPSACNKIVKKELYETIGLSFVEGLKFEDLGTNPVILSQLETIKYIEKPYYEYTIRQNSIMRTKVEYNMIDVLKILEERMNKYITKPYDKKEFMAYVFFWRVEESILNQLYSLDTEARKNMIDYMYANIFPILEQLYQDNEYVQAMITRIDEETKNYILERNKAILDKTLEKYLEEKIKTNTYKILTPALILYNYDNRA